MWTEIIDRPGYKGLRFVKVDKEEAEKKTEIQAKKHNPKPIERELVTSKRGKRWTKTDENALVGL